MTIQRLNLGTAPTGVGGDTERSAFKKIDDNFGDTGNACSRIVGTAQGNVMEVGAFGFGGTGMMKGDLTTVTAIKTDMLNKTQVYRIESDTNLTYKYAPNFYMQTGNTAANISISHGGQGVKISAWLISTIQDEYLNTYAMYHNRSTEIYNTTTASSPNVFVTSSGELQRSTSSERYKKDIKHIELSDKEYAAIRQVKPIAYKSVTEADNPNHTFQSFSAEELAKASPTLVLWEYDETVADENGQQVTRKLPERRPAGLNLNGIVALQHAFSLKQAALIDAQAKQIKKLAERVTALENKGVA